ncbi:unnamed protein product [Adineta steineri]|uniref:Geranylgeranyl pyrophosphate synthase n=1 Tax=Adineta steineri TaxID=433720 RepID=A0A819JJV2_9BILA|nr:unnamed protein product [Adineta steineri]CAF3931149.1 unnamed protein product [Adineta steineri]
MDITNTNSILLPDLLSTCPFKVECNPAYEAVSDETTAWINSYGIPYKETTYKCNLVTALCIPHCNRSRFREICDFWVLLLLLDDVLDSVPISKDADQSKQQLSKNMMESMQPAGLFKPLTPFAAALHDCWQRILINITPGCRERFLAGFQAACEASLLQAANQKNRRIVPDLETYIKFRRNASFGLLSLSCIEYSLELDSLDECWKNDTFKCFVDYTIDTFSWTNDIYSFNVEQSRGDYSLITILMHADLSLNIQQAIDRVGQMVISRYADIQRVRSELISWGPKIDSQVETFVNGCTALIIGNVVWSFETPRYFGTDREEVKRTRRVTLLAPMQENLAEAINKQEINSNSNTTEDVSSQQTIHQDQSTFNSISTAKYMDKLLQPYDYLKSFPGKNIRTKLIHAFNYWFKTSHEKLIIIDDIIDKLHNSSLLIDDIEDGSLIRRGSAAAHTIYGIPLTINTAELVCFLTMQTAFKLDHPRVGSVLVDHLVELHKGQGLDIWWRENHICPNEDEYCQMINGKSGGLFHLAIELLRLFSPVKFDMKKNEIINDLCQALTFLFQIRDDYCNLVSEEYTLNKSYCEDITEGKYSFPIIHAINTHPDDTRLSDILKQHTDNIDVKREAIKLLHEFGSIEYTRDICLKLANKCNELIDKLEGNLYLSMVINQLAVIFQVPAENKVE